jgi:hypothetical protein
MLKKNGKSLILVIGLICLAGLSVFAQTEISINKTPLRDFAQFVNEKVTAKEVDLNAEFLVELEGILKKDGHFDIKQTKFTKSEGDEKIIEVAKNAIEAINDSGWFGYLSNIGVEKIKVSLSRDKQTFRTIILSEQPTQNRANTIASGFRFLISTALLMDKTSNKNLSADEKLLLSNTKAVSEGNNFILKIEIPKVLFQEVIGRKLQEVNSLREVKPVQ